MPGFVPRLLSCLGDLVVKSASSVRSYSKEKRVTTCSLGLIAVYNHVNDYNTYDAGSRRQQRRLSCRVLATVLRHMCWESVIVTPTTL